MIPPLPARQRAVFEAVQSYWLEHGIPPVISDVAQRVGLSRAMAYKHMQALHRKGVLDCLPNVKRSWRPATHPPPNSIRIPLVGRIAAGAPLVAVENIEGWVTLDRAPPNADLFALCVEGSSMVGAAILDGDTVIVRSQDDADDGQIIVALIDEDEATVKRLKREAGMIHLVAESEQHPTLVLPPERVRVQGVVIGVVRRLDIPHASGP